jgi:hypothetical protein
MIQWIKIQIESWLSIRRERYDVSKKCDTCEVLKMEVARLHELINKLTTKPEPDVRVRSERSEPIKLPKNMPWSVRRNLLEQADRKKAQLMREAPRPLHSIDSTTLNQSNEPMEKLEKEIMRGVTDAKEIDEVQENVN